MTKTKSIAATPNPISGVVEIREIRIHADVLIPGRGSPIDNGCLIYSLADKTSNEKAKIRYAGSQSDVPHKFSTVPVDAKVPVLMPGLWDCHVHYFGAAEGNFDNLALLPPSLAGMRAARDVVATLNAGFTSVREVAGYGIDFHAAIEEGWIPGPNIYSAGAAISQTAGHGDLHSLPLNTVHDCISHGLPLCLADGVEDATRAVRLQIRRGAKVIKICSTGGVMSRIDSPRAAQFNTSELEAMVEEATRTNLFVAAHAHGTSGIIAALRAGVKTIEHGSYLTKEAIDLMIEKSAILVATRWIQVAGVTHPGLMPEPNFRKLLEVARENEKSYKAAINAGVKCALGTDLGISNTDTGFYHGTNGKEFEFAVDAGMTPLQAIEAGTANGPDTLGRPPTETSLTQAPLSGQLKQGYDADFIALAENPLKDITVLSQPRKITHVWKNGILYKEPGRDVSIV